MPLFYENKAVDIAADTVTARPGTISCQGVEWHLPYLRREL